MPKRIKEWMFNLLIAVMIVICLRTFFWISIVNGPSMLNTIHNGDKVIYIKHLTPHDGDIVIVRMKDGEEIIKRVIAKEGDTIEIENGNLYLNGRIKKEEYIKEPMLTEHYKKTKIPKGSVFVMGDNRNDSADSRIYGTFSLKSQYIGKVIYDFK